jgi:hypothetical protein
VFLQKPKCRKTLVNKKEKERKLYFQIRRENDTTEGSIRRLRYGKRMSTAS